MRRITPFALVFIAGAAVGFFLLRGPLARFRAADNPANRELMAVLDRVPPPPVESDNAIVAAAARIQPAVTNIDTVAERRTAVVDFLGNPYERLQMLQGTGSGVIITSDGFVVTNNHVVEGATIIRVTLGDGRKFDGRVVGADPRTDLAIVKIEGRGLPLATFGNSSGLRVGDYVLAIGNPLGIGTTVTHGIVSATNRHDLPVGGGHMIRNAIQTDAPINKGNSGGALANLRGELIGINTAIYSETGSNIGIGFAIPINEARTVLKSLVARGRIMPKPSDDPFIGVVFASIGPETAESLGIEAGRGVIVDQVRPLTPAADSGLQRGDIVVAVDGRPIRGLADVREAISGHRPGDTIMLRLLRGENEQEDVKLTIGRRPTAMRPTRP